MSVVNSGYGDCLNSLKGLNREGGHHIKYMQENLNNASHTNTHTHKHRYIQ